MIFNADVTNNDDHPRNHALLHTFSGWRLAPAYGSIVPAPLGLPACFYRTGLVEAI